MLEVKTTRIQSIPKWIDLLTRMGLESNQMEMCATQIDQCTIPALRRWHQLLSHIRTESTTLKLEKVNRFMNEWPYINDINLYGRSDVWATPKEFMTNSGDCEDYAIAKYATLRMLGIPAENLRIIVVQDELRGVAHAVMGARIQGQEYILDNLATRPILAKYITQYRPYYAVNETNRWMFLPRQP